MPDFKVWDETNGSEETCVVFEARTDVQAAKLYAAEDQDGLSEGSYHDPGKSLLVRSADGTLRAVVVRVDYEPSFTATESEVR
jgi:hypothetical protein